jgi:multidrug transporter EmrE-like cation transporter
VAVRGYASLPVIMVWAAVLGTRARLFDIRWGLHLLRGALGILMLASFAFALRTLPLSEAYAIFFFAPLLITALAAPILGEKVGANRWWAILIGLVGVLILIAGTYLMLRDTYLTVFPPPAGPPSETDGLSALIVFFRGVQLFVTGILGEYVGRTYLRSGNDPQYIVRERILARAGKEAA